MHVNPLAFGVGDHKTRFRVGTAMDAVDVGDFVTGKSAGARVFYDQSAETMYFYDAANTQKAAISTVSGGFGIVIGGNAFYNQGIVFPNDFIIADTGRLSLGDRTSFWLDLHSSSGVVINDGGSASIDFRVEGDTDANLFFTDASADTVLIGLSVAGGSGKLEVNGRIVAVGDLYLSPNIVISGIAAASNGTVYKSAAPGYGNVADQAFEATAYLFSTAGAAAADTMLVRTAAQVVALENAGGTVLVQISGLASTATVFNEQGADTDFRIEGDTDANLFFTDASADKIGVGTNAPVSKVDIRGGDVRIGDSTSVAGTPTAGTRLLQFMAFW